MAEPRRLTDLHNHLLPGVDDGSASIDESLRHLTDLARDGVARLAFSPHLNGTLVYQDGALNDRLARLEAAFESLTTACRDRDDVPALGFGQEIYVPDPDTAARLLGDRRVGYRGTRYCLIEFGFYLGHPDCAEIVRAAIDAGRAPIVAHPERYIRDRRPVGMEEIESWARAGGILQVNGGSLIGIYGPEIEDLAWRLLETGLARLISSDHHADTRPVSPGAVARAIEARLGVDRVELLMEENPAHVLDDRETIPVQGIETE